jgi:hypothetical protein
MSSDPLMQPFTLKHLVLRNRLMSTAHEPAYTEDGMPKARYRLYHAEKAKGGIALVNLLGYLLSKYNRLGVFIVIWFVGCLLFAVHRSKILPTSEYTSSESMQILFFVLFCVVMLQTFAIVGWMVWKTFVQIRGASQPTTNP